MTNGKDNDKKHPGYEKGLANLVPVRTKEEARERGRNGGKRSGEVRRQKKAVAEYLKVMLDSRAPVEVEERLRANLAALEGEEVTLTAAVAYKQIEEALKGNIQAAQWITELYEKQSRKETNEAATFTLSALNFTKDFVEPYRVPTEALQPYTEAELKDEELRSRRIREIISKGGRGSIKSSWWAEFTYELLINDPMAHAAFSRRFQVDLRDSVYAQWQRTVARLGDLDDWEFTVAPMRATYKPTGQIVFFHGADKPVGKKSFEVPFGHIKIYVAEEADEMQGIEQLDQMEDTLLRKDSPAISVKIYNPPKSINNFMNIYTAEQEDNPATYICHSYYYNVPKAWLGQRFFDRAEWFKEHKPLYYRNNYEGEVTGTGGELFDNVTERKILKSEIASLDTYQGIDWGWEHPQVFVRVAYNPETDTLFILKEHYRHRIKVLPFLKSIATPKGKKKPDEELWDMYANQETICDSANPDKINDAADHGWDAVPAVKRWKGGGRAYGWEWLRGVREIVIDPEVNPKLAKEFRTLEFEQLKDGTFTSNYPKLGEDGVMATIYALNRVITGPKDDEYEDYDYTEDEDYEI